MEGRSVWSTGSLTVSFPLGTHIAEEQVGRRLQSKGVVGGGTSRASEEHTRGLMTDKVSFKHLLSPVHLIRALVTKNFLSLYFLSSLPVPEPGKDLEQKLDNRG